MNENINLCEILKGHEGETFYSPIYGDMILDKIVKSRYLYPIYFTIETGYQPVMQTFTSDGKIGKYNAECLVFPSKDQRDWNIWLEEQKSKVPKTWNDIKYCNDEVWQHISRIDYGPTEPIVKSALALLKINQLIEIGYGGNITNDEWEDTDIKKWYLTPKVHYFFKEEIFDIAYAYNRSYKCAIAFHTGEQAKEFLKYPENVQLLKDYFMIS